MKSLLLPFVHNLFTRSITVGPSLALLDTLNQTGAVQLREQLDSLVVPVVHHAHHVFQREIDVDALFNVHPWYLNE